MKQRLGPQAYQTFQIAAPKETHTVPATCEEVECDQYLRGWRMTLDLGTDLGKRQAQYIKHSSGRKYRVTRQADGIVDLEFPGNQPCFREHRRRIERPEVYRVKGGDHRGNPLGTPARVHTKPEFWIEEFQENSARLNDMIEKG